MILPPLNKAYLFFLARYLFSGGSAFAVNLSLFFIFTRYFHVWYLTASSLAFFISVIVSFTMQKFVTFRDRTTDKVHLQAVLYVALLLFNMAGNGVLVFSFVELGHIPHMLAQVFSAGIIAVWSLVVYRSIIFKNAPVF